MVGWLSLQHYYFQIHKGRVRAARLPPYAPELKPVEYMWAHLKSPEIANLSTTQAWVVSLDATTALLKIAPSAFDHRGLLLIS